jgi:hypothetical protein
MRHETRANFRSVRSFHRRRGEKCPDAGALRISHAFGGREQQSGRIHNNGWRGRLTLPFANAHPTLINSPASQAASSSGTSSKFTKCPAGRSAYHYSSLLRTAQFIHVHPQNRCSNNHIRCTAVFPFNPSPTSRRPRRQPSPIARPAHLGAYAINAFAKPSIERRLPRDATTLTCAALLRAHL